MVAVPSLYLVPAGFVGERKPSVSFYDSARGARGIFGGKMKEKKTPKPSYLALAGPLTVGKFSCCTRRYSPPMVMVSLSVYVATTLALLRLPSELTPVGSFPK